jgi:hypothetical protein
MCTTKKMTNEGDKNFFCHKCKKRFPLPFLSMTFRMPWSENCFHSLKPILVIEGCAAEGDSLWEQYKKGNPEKSIGVNIRLFV